MPPAIKDGDLHFGMDLEAFRQEVLAVWATRAGATVPPLDHVANEIAPLLARINHGRWIVDCPDCNSAGYVWLARPLFLCSECWNEQVDGRWRLVTFPGAQPQIEQVLEPRPKPNRNWRPGESLAALVKDNLAHGHPVTLSEEEINGL